jgi:hypothetical protein
MARYSGLFKDQASLAVRSAVFLAILLFIAFLFCIPLKAGAGEKPDESDISLDVAREDILTAPFAAPRLNFFHASLEVPPLESPRTLPAGIFYAKISSSHALSKKNETINGIKNYFNGQYHEWGRLNVSMGVTKWLDIAASLTLAGWDETMDNFPIFDKAGHPIVRFEDQDIFGLGVSARHDNISKGIIEAKAHLWGSKGFDLAFASSLKIPIGRPRDLTNAGTFDLNVSLLGSYTFNHITLYANCGEGFPLGEQNLFVKEAHVDLNPFFYWGIGANWEITKSFALALQLEGNTPAFREVRFLDYPALTLFGGLRKYFGSFFIEGGAGGGLIHRGSYDYNLYASVGYLFKGW